MNEAARTNLRRRRVMPWMLVAVAISAVASWTFVFARSHPAAAEDAYTRRLEALASLQALNVALLTNDSATVTLERWCASHGMADPARVVADRDRSATLPPTPQQRAQLGVTADEEVRHRRVKLRCGTHVLSEADNWYVPSRLTPEMNQTLETTDIAFGRVVRVLRFRRQRLEARSLWSPLPDGWDVARRPPRRPATTLDLPPELLRHVAVLVLPDGRPISLVHERYTRAVLGHLRTR